MIIELWNSEALWDKLLGINWISLNSLISNQTCSQFWISLDSELCIRNGIHIVGTKNPTNHNIFVEIRVENLQIENSIINIDDDLAKDINSIINSNNNFNLNNGYDEQNYDEVC